MEAKKSSRGLSPLAGWAGLALAIGLLSYGLSVTLLKKLELNSGDLMFQLRGPMEAETPLVIVAVDDASFAQNELQWPWPRDYFARIVDGIAAGNPAVIAMDVFFYEPSSDPAADAALAESIARAGNVILVNDISVQSQGGVTLRQYNTPLPELTEAAITLGLTNFQPDADGAVRTLLSFQEHNGELFFSWSMQAPRLYRGEDGFQVVSGNRVLIGDRPVTLENQFLRVNFLGPAGSIRTYSAYQVVDGLVDPSVFEGKIVLIGTTSESLHDSYPTPFGAQPPMPGVEINAHAINTILSGNYIYPTSPLAGLVISAAAALVSIVMALRLRPLAALGIVAGLIALYLAASFLLFSGPRILMPVVGPLAGLGLTYVVGTSIQLYQEQRKRAQVRGLFERYVAPAAIDQMLSQSGSIEALRSGQRRELTILFSDIRGFTTMSEKLTPDEVVEILDEYLEAMTELIFQYEGTIDKFEGDAILAIWNAPLPVEDHATKTVQCGQAMIRQLDAMQARWTEKGHQPLKIGVGINTGQVFVGNIGSARRLDYTVIGDAVNLASRLQDLTKEAKVPLLFSEATRDKLSSEIKTRFVTTAQVKGRAQAVNVYTVDEG